MQRLLRMYCTPILTHLGYALSIFLFRFSTNRSHLKTWSWVKLTPAKHLGIQTNHYLASSDMHYRHFDLPSMDFHPPTPKKGSTNIPTTTKAWHWCQLISKMDLEPRFAVANRWFRLRDLPQPTLLTSPSSTKVCYYNLIDPKLPQLPNSLCFVSFACWNLKKSRDLPYMKLKKANMVCR